MTSPVTVRCERTPGGHRCTVVVGDDPRATSHAVNVADGVLERLAPAVGTALHDTARAEALVRASFAFLLVRVPPRTRAARGDPAHLRPAAHRALLPGL